MRRYDRDALLAGVDLPTLADELLGGHCGSERSPTWSCPIPTHAQTGQTPPLSIFVTRWGEQRWRCHGCGASGSAIDLVMHARGVPVREAMEWLGGRATAEPIERLPRTRSTRRRDDLPRLEPDPSIDGYVDACQKILWSSAGAGPRRWLTETRCLSEDVLRRNRVGFDPGARRLDRPDGVPRSAGVVLPVLDEDRTAIFTQTRRLGHFKGPRYLNCAARAAPNPRIARYQCETPALHAVVVCEGAIDALTVADAGYNSIALLGSSIADERVAMEIMRSDGPIVLAFDADDAGDRGATRLAGLLREQGRVPTRLRPESEFVDLNEWRTRAGTDWIRQLGDRVDEALSAREHALRR